MNTGSYVFAQMVKFLDEFVFLRIVKKYDGDNRNVSRSNLSKANNTRDYRIFEEFAYHTSLRR